ncbi:hypothetical protein BDN67DRAFT_970528 [Paxillus ammoniavirescens]|nr:hypothetical protein BDN67DRAFT_970528 [Paxillus ammoniavirescens]
MASTPINIVLFGQKGVGKSSIINLIAGREVADTSPDVGLGAMSSKKYSIRVGQRSYNIWETVGMEEPGIGVNPQPVALRKAFTLIKQLSEQGGVDLLLFCIRGSGITATTGINHRLFYKVLCGKEVPIALVITHLEQEGVMEAWWSQNTRDIKRHGLENAGHACITGLPDQRSGGKYVQSKLAIEELLEACDGGRKYTMSHEAWCRKFREQVKLEQIPQQIPHLQSGTPYRNVIFIGEMGAGKSSIINLIADDDLATTSNDAAPCTTEIAYYDVPIWGRMYRLWDTPGLHPASRFRFAVPAPERVLKSFLRERYLAGEIDLVVFCCRSGRAHKSMESAYKTFCKTTRQVAAPVVIAVTCLEKMQPAMDAWWVQNGRRLEEQGLVFDGHVCVTCIPHVRRQSAKEEIRDLLANDYQWEASVVGSEDYLNEGGCTIA